MFGQDTGRSSSDVLMESVERVEGAKRVFVIVEHDRHVTFRTNCTHQEAFFLLEQAKHCLMRDLFPVFEDDVKRPPEGDSE